MGFLLAIAILLAAAPTSAQTCDHVSTACSLESAMPTSNPRTCALDVMNKHACMLNLLRERAVGSGSTRTACTSITVPAGTRSTYALSLQASLLGSEIIVPSIAEESQPPMLDVAGQISGASGTTVSVPVFNRAEQARTGRLCVAVFAN